MHSDFKGEAQGSHQQNGPHGSKGAHERSRGFLAKTRALHGQAESKEKCNYLLDVTLCMCSSFHPMNFL